jgi:DNA-directed RNA polymerase specialized sigma24 family protein
MNTTTNTTDTKTPDPATAPRLGPTADIEPLAPGNDNAARGGIPDTTPLVAHPDVVRHLRATLRRYRVTPQNMADAIADVQAESIETARTRGMPWSLAQWKALATTIAVHWALDRLRAAKVRSKYDAGLCDDADANLRPTLRWEHRCVSQKSRSGAKKSLFDSSRRGLDWTKSNSDFDERSAARKQLSRSQEQTTLCSLGARPRQRGNGRSRRAVMR